MGAPAHRRMGNMRQAVTTMQPSPTKTYPKKGLDQGEAPRPDRAAT
jgi:hypothetical protein